MSSLVPPLLFMVPLLLSRYLSPPLPPPLLLSLPSPLPPPPANPRRLVLAMLSSLGRLCELFSSSPSYPSPAQRPAAASALARFFLALRAVSLATGHELSAEVGRKLALNARKYPKELCYGKAGKYTDYTGETGIAKDRSSQAGGAGAAVATVPGVVAAIGAFVRERGWAQFHTPRNVLLALSGEAGELAEVFQWKGEGAYGWEASGEAGGAGAYKEADRVQIGQELADCAIYSARLSELIGVDLDMAIRLELRKA